MKTIWTFAIALTFAALPAAANAHFAQPQKPWPQKTTEAYLNTYRPRNCPKGDAPLRLTGQTKIHEIDGELYLEMKCDHGHSYWMLHGYSYWILQFTKLYESVKE